MFLAPLALPRDLRGFDIHLEPTSDIICLIKRILFLHPPKPVFVEILAYYKTNLIACSHRQWNPWLCIAWMGQLLMLVARRAHDAVFVIAHPLLHHHHELLLVPLAAGQLQQCRETSQSVRPGVAWMC